MIEKIEVLIKYLKAELAALEANLAASMHMLEAKKQEAANAPADAPKNTAA